VRAIAHRIALAGPSDVRELDALLDAGAIRAEEIVAIIAKTEGNGGRNDFSRELAVRGFGDAIARRIGVGRELVEERVVLSVSGGCEGVVSPHAIVLGRRDGGEAPRAGEKRLAIGVGRTRPFSPEEIGRGAQITATADVVRSVARGLGVETLADVHLVQIKGAIPPVAAGRSGSASLRCDMAWSRAASALGVGVALGEVDPARATDDAIAHDFSLFSSVASVSAKPGLVRSEVVVVANSPTWGGDLTAAHDVMADAIDGDALGRALARLGLAGPPRDHRERVVAVLAKAEANPSREIRGRRHVMLDDDDVSDTRWARAAVAAVLASALGDTAVYVSTRAEHMGPAGGGPVAVIARVG
jgi:cyanuric acid amidohydrolase